MRWQRLFDDLAAQLDEQTAAQRVGEVAERTRVEVGQIELADRLRQATGARISLVVGAEIALRCQLQRVGIDWLSVVDDLGVERLVMLRAVVAVGQLGTAVAAPRTRAAAQIAERLDARHALRAIARDRSGVRILNGPGVHSCGTIDRVGADFIDLAIHPLGESRPLRPTTVQAMPISAITQVVSSS